MIFKWFIRHQWKEMKRSSIWQKNVAINIVLGFFLLLMLLYLLILGLFIDKILEELYPDRDPVVVFNGIILYYLGIEFFLRFFMQSLPTLNIETYLHLPIKKSSIVHYVASKSVVVVGNYLSWLVFFPFAFKVIAPAYSTATAWVWIICMILLIFSNNFLATYIKRQLTGKPVIVGVFGLVMILLILLDYFGLISLSALSSYLFGQLLKQPLYIVVPALILIFTYSLNYFFLKSRLYPEEVILKKKDKVDSLSNIKYLKTLGLTGQLISMDLRLLWRHKRTRSIIYMAPLFLGYGFFFYPQPVYREAYVFLIFVGIFMTGGMMLNYTNYCFGYESNYFDNILANYKDFERYIRVKYLFAVSIATVCYVLTIPYVFFGTDILLINSMTFLYNIGFLSFVLFYFATFSKKRMDLRKGAAFNYQGLGASHWLSMLPAFLLPVIIYLPFSWAGVPKAGLLFIGALGVAGLLFHKTMLNIILKQFLKRKYVMAEGFRK
ncbi:MAG: hypothetical protein H8D45_12890 [Bacteroidetes bacterium]|nr:hypothetical protein [Bacteroidota bacterium]MBL7105693.1 hypothetical protein [Bacteroidales bacterium]